MDAPEIQMPPDLRPILALAVCCDRHWADGARTILRQIWENASSDVEASSRLQILVKALTAQQRFWLATFDGNRKKVFT